MKMPSFKCFLCLLLLVVLSECRAELSELLIHKENREKISVSVETAKTREARGLGLMYRKSLKKNSGMLFIFEEEKQHPFTMKNTYIPLDMIFISRTKKIVGIIENTRPLTRGPYSIKTASKYVLEVNAGFCSKNGISIGDQVVLDKIAG